MSVSDFVYLIALLVLTEHVFVELAMFTANLIGVIDN